MKTKQQKVKKARKLPVKKQILLLKSLHTLATSNLGQKEIAERLVEFGTRDEQALGYAVLEQLKGGGTFAMAARPWFDGMAWEALMAGEKTGVWAKGITNALKILEVSGSVGMAFFIGLSKPVGMVVVMMIALAGAKIGFFPKIMELYDMSRWGGLSLAAYNAGDFIIQWWKVILSIVICALAFLVLTIKFSVGLFRSKLDKLPFYRHYRLVLAANLLRSIGNLTLAGFGIKEAIRSTKASSNAYLTYHLDKAIKNIGRGYQNIGEILDTGLMDKAEQSTLKVLGEKGNYGQTLVNCSEITQEKVSTELDRLQKVIYNTLMPIGGLLSILLMGGIGLLMFDLSTNIG